MSDSTSHGDRLERVRQARAARGDEGSRIGARIIMLAVLGLVVAIIFFVLVIRGY